MKIQLIVHHELDPNSGAAGQTHLMWECYRAEGHEAVIYSWSDLPSRLSPRLKQLLFPLFVARHLWRTTRRDRLDVIDASTGDTWLWTLIDPARRRTLLVTTSHGLEHVRVDARRRIARDGLEHLSWKFPLYYGGLHLREVELTLRRADVVFLLNHYDRTYAVDRLGVEPGRIRMVTNGIRDSLCGLSMDPTPLGPPDPIRVALSFSYLPLKGIKYGVEAIGMTLRRYPNVSATLLGTGVNSQIVLRDFDPELHGRIKIIERYENSELPSYLRAHQIILFPTLTEGFGVALLEGMACGLAPVSTTTPGPLEFVRPYENGLLVAPGDSVALARAIETLIDDRELLDRLRQAAQTTAQQLTSRAAAYERLTHYEEALSAKEQVADAAPA